MQDRSGPAYDHVNRKLTCLLHCALYRRGIRLTCPACALTRCLDGVGLWWLFETKRWDDSIPSAWQRLYCPVCWKSKRRKVRPRAEITTEHGVSTGLPYPSQSEWRRVVSRYRG